MPFKAPVRRILIIKTRAIGDTVLLTGLLRLLHERKPNYQIDVVAKLPGSELLEGLPFISRVVNVSQPKSKMKRLSHWMRLYRRLRKHKYDWILNFHASFRTALLAKSLRGKVTVVNNHDLTKPNWFSDVPVPGKGEVKSIIERDLDVLRAIGIYSDASQCQPEIVLTDFEKKNAAKMLSEKLPVKGPKLFLGVGASRATKKWPAKHFVALMEKLVRDFDASFVIAKLKSDEEWMNDFTRHLLNKPELRTRVAIFEKTHLRDAAALVAQCQLYIGNDSGMKHISAALKIPTFTFFGPELPKEWHPYEINLHPYGFIANMECRTAQGKHWCSIQVCDAFDHQCMKKITPETVYPILSSVLEKMSDSFL